MNGLIFDLKRFAVHDGEGIRSTLFLKGCPLHCPWCQNPEGILPEVTLWYHRFSCVLCGACVESCLQKALSLNNRIHIDRNRCNVCGNCVSVCPTAAIKKDSRKISVQEAMKMLLRDKVFFGKNGGITLSGGEVLMQTDFAFELLSLCKDEGVDTAIETCLYGSKQSVSKLLSVVNHFLVDIKYMDDEVHKKILGASNAVILENYQYLLDNKADVLVRTPLIPGYTATTKNIREIARHVAKTTPTGYELLNFNPLCRSKYADMEQPYCVEGGVLADEQIMAFYDIIEKEGVKNIIKDM